MLGRNILFGVLGCSISFAVIANQTINCPSVQVVLQAVSSHANYILPPSGGQCPATGLPSTYKYDYGYPNLHQIDGFNVVGATNFLCLPSRVVKSAINSINFSLPVLHIIPATRLTNSYCHYTYHVTDQHHSNKQAIYIDLYH